MSEKCEKEGQSYEKQETWEIQSQGKVAAKRTEHARKTHLREKHEKNLSTTPDWVSTKIDLMYSCVAKSCIHSWIYCVQRRPAFLSVLFRCLEGMATCGRILFCILLCARTGILDQNLQPSAFCKPMQESLCSEWAKVCATPRQICSMNILTWSWWSPQAADLPMYWFASRLATNSIASTEWSKMFSVLSCKSWVLFPPYELSTVSMNCTCEILRSGGSRAKQSKTQLRLNLAKAASAAYLAWYHVHP